MLVDVLLYVIVVLHVILSPYTKVEESFNLHATHDILMYGVGLDGLRNVSMLLFAWRSASKCIV